MNRTTGKKYTALSRIFIIMLSFLMLLSSTPVEAMAVIVNEYFENRLEYQQIDAYINEDGSEMVALEGEMPVDASVSVKPVENTDSTAICSYDITIYKDGIEFQPDADNPINVEIKNTLIGSAIENEYELQLWHIRDDGTEEQITDFTVDGDMISFAASGFSVYKVVDVNDPPLGTYEFYKADKETGELERYMFSLDSGSTNYRQIIHSGEMLTVPQLPADKEGTKEGYTFMGWYIYDESTGKVSDTAFDFSVAPTFDKNTLVKLVAKYSKCAYIIFHEQYDPNKADLKSSDDIESKKGAWPITATRRGELDDNGKTQIPIGDMKVTYDSCLDEEGNSTSQKVFVGWTVVDYIADPSAERTIIVPDENGCYEISTTTNLYPVFSEIYWVNFDAQGGSLAAPQFIYAGNTMTSFPQPTRKGYSFAGWSTSPNGSVLNSYTPVEDNTTLYAVWTPAKADYTIVVWKQKSTDEAGGEKHYDYSESISYKQQVYSGSTVNVPAALSLKNDYTGFNKNTTNSDKSAVVNGDGSTVLNVYYDRNVRTVTFYSDENCTKQIHSFSALYGSNIFDKFTFKYNNTTYPTDTSRWTPHGSTVYTNVFIAMVIMPDEDLKLSLSTTSNPAKYYDFYVEALPGEGDKTFSYSSKNYSLRMHFKHNYGIFTLAEDFWDLEGFSKDKSLRDDGINELTASNNSLSSGKTYYFTYNRNQYDLTFCGENDSEQIDIETIPFEDTISKYVIPDPTNAPDGMEFAGWYMDTGLSVRIFFEEPTQSQIDSTKDEKGEPHYQVYERMPASNLIVYAGWKPITYEVSFDPNGGEIYTGSDSSKIYQPTSVFVEYGENVMEYDEFTVHRDYVSAKNGTYFYHYEPYDGNDPDNPLKGKAYYTDNPSQANNTLQTYRYVPDSYRFADWYEVDPETGEETLFNFETVITHDTHLVLHWKDLTTYFIEYQPGIGVIDNNDDNEEKFVILDESNYTDRAKVIITRTIAAEDKEGNSLAKYNFIGWSIRGDDSGTVYFPGQSFEFDSEFAEIRLDEGENEKRYIVLDAVYEQIGTAKLIYDANGGTFESTADSGTIFKEYHEAFADGDNPTVASFTSDKITISNIPNNSYAVLSDGSGLSNAECEFTGWNTMPDGSGEHFDAASDVIVNKAEPLTLYAEWKVNVYFDKANDAASWHNTKWDSDVYDKTNNNQYHTKVFLNSFLTKPLDIPSIDSNNKDNLLFRFWTDENTSGKLTDDYQFDFGQPITKDITLYAYYSEVNSNLHVVDATLKTPVYKDNWIKGGNSNIIFRQLNYPLETLEQTSELVDLQENYQYAFAYVGSYEGIATTPDISEADKITDLRYDPVQNKVLVTYAGGRQDTELTKDKAVFLVYYTHPKTVDVNYFDAESFAQLKAATDASVGFGDDAYNMNSLTAKYNGLADEYKYYSYAIGKGNAGSVADMYYISSAVPIATNGTGEPNIIVRDTWKGIEYSIDDGTTWYDTDNGTQLYVLYYPVDSTPVVVNLREKTIGSKEDLNKEFTYEVKIETYKKETIQVQRKNGNKYTNASQSPTVNGPTLVSGSTISYTGNNAIALSNDMSKVFTLNNTTSVTYGSDYKSWGVTYRDETTTETYQVITITQIYPDGFEYSYMVNDNASSNVAGNPPNNLTWTYSTQTNPNSQNILYTNIHTPLPVDLHVAVLAGDKYVNEDENHLTDDTDVNTLNIANNSEWEQVQLDDRSKDIFVNGEYTNYKYAGFYYVTEDADGNIISYEKVSDVNYGDVDGNLEVYVNRSENKDKIVDSLHKLYYFYYPPVTLQYMKSGANNKYFPLNSVTYKGEVLSIGGTGYKAKDTLDIGNDVYTISGGNADYKVIGNIDDGTNYNALVSPQIGIKDSEGRMILTGDAQLSLKLEDGIVKYSIDGETEWKSLPFENVVYLVYKKNDCYNLELKKKVIGDDKNAEYILTIYSDKLIPGAQFTASDDETLTVSENKTLVLNVYDGSDITIFELPKGNYTVTESGMPELCVMSATVSGYDVRVTDNSFGISLIDNTNAEITNTITDTPVTGVNDNALPYMLLMLITVIVSGLFYITHRKHRGGENFETDKI